MPSRAPRRGAAARWGHRALPLRGTGGAHDHGERAMGGEGRECGARGKAAHGNRDTSGAHVAKPRTAAVSHRGRCDAAARAGRPGGQAARPTAMGHECGARRRGG